MLLPSRRRSYAAGLAVVVIFVLILSGCLGPTAEEASSGGPTGPTEESPVAEIVLKVFIQDGSDLEAVDEASGEGVVVEGVFPIEGATATLTIEG